MWSIKQQITFWQLYRTSFVKGHEIKATGLQSPFSLPLVKCSSKRRFIPLFSRYLFLPYFFPFFFLIPDQLLINARHNRYVEKNKGTREREREKSWARDDERGRKWPESGTPGRYHAFFRSTSPYRGYDISRLEVWNRFPWMIASTNYYGRCIETGRNSISVAESILLNYIITGSFDPK